MLPSNNSACFLLPEHDGLPMRDSQPYAKYKLKAVETYLNIANIAVKKTNWRGQYYIDLQAGPGKNLIDGSVALGSPLLSLLTKRSFTAYRFNEKDAGLNDALQQRVNTSPLKDRVKIYQEDVNKVVYKICDEIDAKDRDKSYGNIPPTLNIAFLDPEGLELHWETVERLARVRKMDLIINFSTSGLIRCIGAGELDAVDRFFGIGDWRHVYRPTDDATHKRRALIDFYLSRLQKFGYTSFKDDPDSIKGKEIAFKNSRNVQVYSLIFASKHPLADRLWQETTKISSPQPRLL